MAASAENLKQPESLKDFMLSLMEDKYADDKKQLAANLAFIVNHKLGKDNIDRNKIELLLASRGHDYGGNRRLIMVYDGKVLLRGFIEEEQGEAVEGLLEASAQEIDAFLSVVED